MTPWNIPWLPLGYPMTPFWKRQTLKIQPGSMENSSWETHIWPNMVKVTSQSYQFVGSLHLKDMTVYIYKSLYINGVSALKTGDIYIYLVPFRIRSIGTLNNNFLLVISVGWLQNITSKNGRFIKHPLKNASSMIVLFVTPFPMITYITVDVQPSYMIPSLDQAGLVKGLCRLRQHLRTHQGQLRQGRHKLRRCR